MAFRQIALAGVVACALAQPAILLPAIVQPARAETLYMLSVGALRHSIDPTVEEFRQASGHVVSILSGTAGLTQKRLMDGEPCDVIAAPARTLEILAKEGKVDIGSKRDLGSIRIGVGLRKGDAAPDISTLDAFKRALLATPRLVYSHPSSGASSGIHFDKMVKQMGLEAQLGPKTVFRQGGTAVMDAVAKGEGDLGITQISEIVPVAGVYVVGPIPAEVQNATTYSVAVCQSTKNLALAQAWIDVLRAGPTRARLQKAGFETP
jgi:molybdate transport system substrate-binding protein